ncbi:GNAT family N-acetyltransferase [Nonomuraea soli]|uniref:Ribosomal protein S18 acetylase RimI-like enzyme n=1 Tax=Nonomuraea soli TaxID=1032476 RepID=A0A7W0CJW8_9ACTN|nr:GNAT family N-acetyltransferase [Nonomuraea soli]MBA2892549.1 ribosomal protein S18 acetylase RimI-like enzyme [Nonomuraea soli]
MIRAALPDDVPAIEEIVQAAYQPWAELIGVRPKPMDEDYPALQAAGRIFVHGSPVDALIVLVPEPGVLYVDNVAVRPSLHGRGVGRRLLAFAEERALDLGLPALRLITNVMMKRNIALYERLGYVITSVEPIGPREVVSMRKTLRR